METAERRGKQEILEAASAAAQTHREIPLQACRKNVPAWEDYPELLLTAQYQCTRVQFHLVPPSRPCTALRKKQQVTGVTSVRDAAACPRVRVRSRMDGMR